MYEQYRDRVAFVLVYIREAHPEDGWQMGANTQAGVVFNQPVTLDDRTHVATSCQKGLDLSMPMVLDAMDNKVGDEYAGWPDRLYLVDVDGKVAYKGGPGPGGFRPDELATSIETELAREDLPHALAVTPALFADKPTTSVEILHPWDAGGSSNLMFPENLFAGEETIFTGQNWVELETTYPQEDQPDVLEIVPSRLVRYEHKLGDEYILRGTAEVKDGAIDLELSQENPTEKPLKDIRAQICFASQSAEDFASKELEDVKVPLGGEMSAITSAKEVGSWGGLKRYLPVKGIPNPDKLTPVDIPFISLVNRSGDRAVGLTWQGVKYLTTNGELACIHADPSFPDCAPGETVTARGRIVFGGGSAKDLLESNREAIEEVWTD